jgi:hypothetical protein
MVTFNLLRDYLLKEAMGIAGRKARHYKEQPDWFYNLTDIMDGRAREWNKLIENSMPIDPSLPTREERAQMSYYNRTLANIKREYFERISYYMTKYNISIKQAQKLYCVLIGFRSGEGLWALALGPYRCPKDERALARKYIASKGIPATPDALLKAIQEDYPEIASIETPKEIGYAKIKQPTYTRKSTEEKTRDALLRYRADMLNLYGGFVKKYGQLTPELVKSHLSKFVNKIFEAVISNFNIPYMNDEQIAQEMEKQRRGDPTAIPNFNPTEYNAEAEALRKELEASICKNGDDLQYTTKAMPLNAPTFGELGAEGEESQKKWESIEITGIQNFLGSNGRAVGEQVAPLDGPAEVALSARGILKLLETCFRHKGPQAQAIFEQAMDKAAAQMSMTREQFARSLEEDIDYVGMKILTRTISNMKADLIKKGDLATASLLPSKCTVTEFRYPGKAGQVTYTALKVPEDKERDLDTKILVLTAIKELIASKAAGGQQVKESDITPESIASYCQLIIRKHPQVKGKGEFTPESVKDHLDLIKSELAENKAKAKKKGKKTEKYTYSGALQKAIATKRSLIEEKTKQEKGLRDPKELLLWANITWAGTEAENIIPATRGRINRAIDENTFGSLTENMDLQLNSTVLSKMAIDAKEKRDKAPTPISLVEAEKVNRALVEQYIGKMYGSISKAPRMDIPTIEDKAEAEDRAEAEDKTGENSTMDEDAIVPDLMDDLEMPEEQNKPVNPNLRKNQETPDPELDEMEITDITQDVPQVKRPPRRSIPTPSITEPELELDEMDLQMDEPIIPKNPKNPKKKKPAPTPEIEEEDVLSYTIKNLVKIASDLDDNGKFGAAEEIHKIIRKYINR